MKSLKEIADELVLARPSVLAPHQFLDKNLSPSGQGGHCYIDEVYENLFSSKRISAKKILEIGVRNGGSMLLWERYFPNAEIHGIDVEPVPRLFFWEIYNRIKIQICDAYTTETIESLGNDYDIIIDDAAHSLDTMRFFVKNYLTKLAPNGIAIIEDIPSADWIRVLLEDLSPNGMKTKIQVFDLRNINMLYDDMVLVIQRIG